MHSNKAIYAALGVSAAAAAGYFVYRKYKAPSATPKSIQYVQHGDVSAAEKVLQIGKGTSSNDKELAEMSFEDCECKYGFKRPEFQDGELLGTIDPHAKHVVLCTGTTDWPANVDQYGDGIGGVWSSSLKKLRKTVGKIKFTLSDAPCSGSGSDVLIFPDMIRYNNVKKEQIPDLIERHFVKDEVCQDIEHETLKDVYVFVCTHTSRDMRCGVCGPQLISSFHKALDKKQFAHMKDRVTILSTSHVGGHKYAGNVVVYKKLSKGQYVGDWYGYVQPSDVDQILSEDIGKGHIVKSLWRGRGSLSKEMQRKFVQLF